MGNKYTCVKIPQGTPEKGYVSRNKCEAAEKYVYNMISLVVATLLQQLQQND